MNALPKPEKPEDWRARCVTMHEGQYLYLNDMVSAIQDDAFVQHCAIMLKVGQERGDSAVECVRRVLGAMIFTLSGHEAAAKKQRKPEGGSHA